MPASFVMACRSLTGCSLSEMTSQLPSIAQVGQLRSSSRSAACADRGVHIARDILELVLRREVGGEASLFFRVSAVLAGDSPRRSGHSPWASRPTAPSLPDEVAAGQVEMFEQKRLVDVPGATPTGIPSPAQHAAGFECSA